MDGVNNRDSQTPVGVISVDSDANRADDSTAIPISTMSVDQSVDSDAQIVKVPNHDVETGQDKAEIPSTVDPVQGQISEDDMKVLQRVLKWYPSERRRLNTSYRPTGDPTKLILGDEEYRGPLHVWSVLTSSQEDHRERNTKNTTLEVIEGLVNHFSALEGRIKKLEEGGEISRKKKKKTEEATQIDTADNLTVKFYDSSAHLDKMGKYQDVHDGAEHGSYMCDEDPKYLIRALYTKTKDETVAAKVESEISEPEPDDIDLLSFGILSKPVASFFEKLLGLVFDNGNLVRFGKPFRPLIRHYRDLKEQLRQLEQKYDTISSQAQSPNSQDTRPQSLNVSQVQEERSPSPSPGLQDQATDSSAPFDRPTAIPHLRVLLSFIDKYLGKQVQLFERIREGKEDRVAFKDLWMVFDAKDVIYCPLRDTEQKVFKNKSEDNDHTQVRRHSSQAYQVVSTSGGMPFASTVAATMKGVDNQGTQELVVESSTEGFRVDRFKIRKARSSYSDLIVYCFSIDFNGVEYGIVREVFVFKPYESKMDVRNLQAFPIRYTSETTQDSLVERGRKFINVTKVTHMQYEGLTAGSGREDINSPVVVDMKSAFESEPTGIDLPRFASPTGLLLEESRMEAYDLWGKPTCSIQWCHDISCHSINLYKVHQNGSRTSTDHSIKPALEEYDQIKLEGAEGLNKFTTLMEKRGLINLLPGVVPGFALRNRRWVLLYLSFLHEIRGRNEWKNLVLPKGHQKMVQAMVETYTTKDGTRIGMDLVSGKGEGCIILLHGVPGVGKTSTAECVAAHTSKPLYPITCGDIGVTPEAVEMNMERHFKLAHKWGCVLLLDEADVFLAKRDQRDVVRNGLVSVFLRILEYYSGILFLTTNRVGAIDDAFRSRLHLQLYYPKLSIEQTSQIFKKNFQQIDNINLDREKNNLPSFDYQEVQKKVIAWAKKNFETLGWNGRQIRNGFQTVLALAEFSANKQNKKHDTRTGDGKRTPSRPEVTLELFKIVAKASLQFNKYLRETHGYDEDALAKREKTRADPEEFFTSYNKRPQSDEPRLEDPSELDSDEDSSDESEKDQSDSEKETDDSEESDDEPKKRKGKGKEGKKSSEMKTPKKKASGGKGKTAGKKRKKDRKDESEDEGSESD